MSGISKRVSGSWVSGDYDIMKTATDTITTLPAIIYPNDTTATVGLKGNMEQNGTPTPQNPIQPSECGERTENIINYDIFANGYSLNLTTGKPISTAGKIANLTPIDVSQYNSICIAFGAIKNCALIYSLIANNTMLERKSGLSSPQIIDTSNADTLYLSFYSPDSGSYILLTDMTYVMGANSSTVVPYEPYGYKIPISSGQQTTNIYLGSVQTVRQIKKYEFTGNETITSVSQITLGYRFRVSVPMTDMSQDNRLMSLCTHFQCVSDWNELGITPSLNGAELFFMISDISTSTAFTAYLQQQYANGTPVTVYYVLATPETAAVNEPLMKIGDYADTVSGITIPTITGKDTFDVETALKPSEVELTYTGWHDASVKEWDGSEWQ